MAEARSVTNNNQSQLRGWDSPAWRRRNNLESRQDVYRRAVSIMQRVTDRNPYSALMAPQTRDEARVAAAAYNMLQGHARAEINENFGQDASTPAERMRYSPRMTAAQMLSRRNNRR